MEIKILHATRALAIKSEVRNVLKTMYVNKEDGITESYDLYLNAEHGANILYGKIFNEEMVTIQFMDKDRKVRNQFSAKLNDFDIITLC